MSGWDTNDVGTGSGDFYSIYPLARPGFGPGMGIFPNRLLPQTALADIHLAQTYLDATATELAAIRLDIWKGCAAQAALEQRRRISALLSQAQDHTWQAASAVSAQHGAVSTKLVCAAATGVY